MSLDLRLTYIGGPTALLGLGGVRLLTDPTFDPAGSEYRTSAYTLRKTQDPALLPDAVGALDAVLLSHDHHFDNLDRAGRELLARAPRILTTPAGAERLGGQAMGLAAWQAVDLPAAQGRVLRVTGTPCRHGPTATEGVSAAQAFPEASIIPLHYEGWEHFSESRPDIERAFRAAGLEHRLRWLEPGRGLGLV